MKTIIQKFLQKFLMSGLISFLILASGCNQNPIIVIPQQSFPAGQCPTGVGGQDPKCCDMTGNLLAPPPTGCSSNTGDGAVQGSLISGFTALQIANDQIFGADLLVGVNGINLDLNTNSASLPGGTTTNGGVTPGSGTPPAYGGAAPGSSSGAAGNLPIVSGGSEAAPNSFLGKVSDFAKNLFGSGGSPQVLSASPESAVGTGGGSGAGSSAAGGSSPTSGATSSGLGPSQLSATGANGAQLAALDKDRALLQKLNGSGGSTGGSEYVSDGGGGKNGGQGNGLGGRYDSDSGSISSGNGQVIALGTGANRNLASLSPMLGDDPEDYFTRISKDESLFRRVNRKYRQKENDLTLVRYETYPALQTLQQNRKRVPASSSLPASHRSVPYRAGGGTHKKLAR